MKQLTTTPHENDIQAAEMLSETSLVYFETSKSPVLPFENYLLKWKVNAPQGVYLQLNGAGHLPLIGSREVIGLQTAYYRLTARVRQMSKFLGTVSVSVDTSTCELVDDVFLQVDFNYWINEVVIAGANMNVSEEDKIYVRDRIVKINNSFYYFPLEPTYRIEGNNMIVKMFLTKKPDYAPDPAIDVTMKFAIGVKYDRGKFRFTPVNPGVTVEINFAPHIEIIPDFITDEHDQILKGKIQAYNAGLSTISFLCDSFTNEYIEKNRPAGKEIHGAAFREADQKLVMTYCRKEALEVEDIGGNAGVNHVIR